MTYTDQELREIDARVAVECYNLPLAPNDCSLVTLKKIPYFRIENDGVVLISDPWTTDNEKWFHQWLSFSPTTSSADSFALLDWCGKICCEQSKDISFRVSPAGVSIIAKDIWERESVFGQTMKIAIALFALELAKAKKG